jgi:hypothetical protein
VIPISGELKDKLKKRYIKPINLPKTGVKKPVLSDCYSCERYDKGPDLLHIGVIHWCVSKEWDRVKKRSVIHYANIELLKCCPKRVKK